MPGATLSVIRAPMWSVGGGAANRRRRENVSRQRPAGRMEQRIVENPWLQLPTDAPYVLQQDSPIVEAFNARCAHGPCKIQRQLLPEPFIGNPGARVCLLNLNPGYSPEDDDWHANPIYRTAIIDNLRHRTAAFPFYFLDPRLKDAPGSSWWRRRSRWWIDDVGIEALARKLFCVELFPYHSSRYTPVPRAVSPDGLVPSSGYAVHLVRAAIRAGRPVVAMRSLKRWFELIPELGCYSQLFHIRNPRGAWLSPGNLEGYDRLVGELRAAP